MDTRYTMRLAAPLSDEEIPAFAERLADIIKGDPAKLQSLLARGTKSLIRATSMEEAERVASVFRRAGLDVEVVPHQPAVVPVAPLEASDPAAEVAAPDHEPHGAMADPTESRPTPPVAEDSEMSPDAKVAVATPPGDVAAAESWSADDSGPAAAEAAMDAVPAEPDPTPSDLPGYDPPSYHPLPGRTYLPSAPATAPAARLLGLIGALLLLLAPFLGAPAQGIAVEFGDLGASNPWGLVLAALGAVSLLPVLLGRIRWLWPVSLLAAALWVYALIDGGRAGDLGSLATQWAWLLFPAGALLMLLAAAMPRPR